MVISFIDSGILTISTQLVVLFGGGYVVLAGGCLSLRVCFKFKNLHHFQFILCFVLVLQDMSFQLPDPRNLLLPAMPPPRCDGLFSL